MALKCEIVLGGKDMCTNRTDIFFYHKGGDAFYPLSILHIKVNLVTTSLTKVNEYSLNCNEFSLYFMMSPAKKLLYLQPNYLLP